MALMQLDYLLHCLLNVAGNLGFGMHVMFDPFDHRHDWSNWPDLFGQGQDGCDTTEHDDWEFTLAPYRMWGGQLFIEVLDVSNMYGYGVKHCCM